MNSASTIKRINYRTPAGVIFSYGIPVTAESIERVQSFKGVKYIIIAGKLRKEIPAKAVLTVEFMDGNIVRGAGAL